jgi:hypothetical protein
MYVHRSSAEEICEALRRFNLQNSPGNRVARCFILKPKIPIFEGLSLENVDTYMAIWIILRTFGIVYDHLVHFLFIWYKFSEQPHNVARLNVARPNVARPNVAFLNVARLNVAFLNVARLNVARLNVARLNVAFIICRPSMNVARPNVAVF